MLGNVSRRQHHVTKLLSHVLSVRSHTVRSDDLTEVGRFTRPKSSGNYSCGQLFIHKKLHYRGVVLFPWVTRVFNRNNKAFPSQFDVKLKAGDTEEVPELPRESYKTDICYQVLVDNRDSPNHKQGIMFLGTDQRKFYTIPGIDYILHDNLLPYEDTSPSQPIQHDLFPRFLEKKSGPGGVASYYSTDMLHKFHEDNFDRLRLKDVHVQTTAGIRVFVCTFYMGSKSEAPTDQHWWRYTIMIENLGDVAVQLRERTWCIYSENDYRETITGTGVVGQEPIIPVGGCFQYSSMINLRSPTGHMWGTYLFEREDKKLCNASIPPSLLESRGLST